MNRLISILFIAVFALGCSEKHPSRPNIIVLLLDTLRADHLTSQGYERNTTPVLDTFGRENIQFEYALTAAPWTPASVASILTGLYPISHGMMPPNGREVAEAQTVKLNPTLTTLAEVFEERGYMTAGVSSNPWVSKEFGYEQGFRRFEYRSRVRAEEINKVAFEILDEINVPGATDDKPAAPFFLYLHYLDPHDPYDPPEGFRDLFPEPLKKYRYQGKMRQYVDRYDGEIRYLDSQVGKLFEYLKEKKLYENTVIVIVSDHGEQFMEHGNWTHGFKLHHEETHVVLMLKTARRKEPARRVTETVSTIDIFPTLLDITGTKIPAEYLGRSLLSEEALQARVGVLSEIRRKFDQKSFTDRDGKRIILGIDFDPKVIDSEVLLKSWDAPRVLAVYDRNKDYFEREKLQDPSLEKRLHAEFDSLLSEAKQRRVGTHVEEQGVSQETLEQLKSLGYMN
jgi:arylsulfatase A-like enzyme